MMMSVCHCTLDFLSVSPVPACPCTEYYFCFLNICNSGLLSYLFKDICTALVAGRCPPPPPDINTTTPLINYISLSHPPEAWLYKKSNTVTDRQQINNNEKI